MIFQRVSGDWKAAAPPAVKVGGVWKPLAAAFVNVGGVWKEAYSASTPPPDSDPIVAYVSPASQYWNTVIPGAAYTSQTEFYVIASGGDGSYSYQWETNNSSASFYNPNGSSTALDSYDGYYAAVRCLVSDGSGNSAYSDWASIQ